MTDALFAVAISDDAGLCLLCRVRRSRTGVHVLIPRHEPGWSPHARYHRTGTSRVRRHGGSYLISQRQQLDASFRGVESVYAMAIGPGEPAYIRTPCAAAEFSDVFAVPRHELPLEEHHTVAVDLVEPGHEAKVPVLGERRIRQKSFRVAVPWIVVTLWRGMSF